MEKQIPDKKRLTHGSLFSGIGGFDLAAEWAGFENIFHCEWNPFARDVLRHHFPNSISYEDITKTSFKRHHGTIDLLSGGFPCQPFSAVGKRKGDQDDRYLWDEMLRAIQEVKPTWVIGENVVGLTTMVQSEKDLVVESQGGLFREEERAFFTQTERFILPGILGDLEDTGYEVQTFIIPACAVGAHHRRDRIWIVAHTDEGRLRQGDRECCVDGKEIREQGKVRSGARDLGSCKHAPDADSERLADGNGCRSREVQQRYGTEEPDSERMWNRFPTQSPVCRRDDGLPFNVDDLSLSYNKWRTESLKAYGNAIVPQVAFRIMECIYEIETNRQREQEEDTR